MAKIIIKQICMGWVDENDVVHPCGKYLGQYEEEGDPKNYPPDPTSHGWCDSCYKKQLEVYKKDKKA